MHDLIYEGEVGLGRIIGPSRLPRAILTVQSAPRPVVPFRPTWQPEMGTRLQDDGSEDDPRHGAGKPAPAKVR